MVSEGHALPLRAKNLSNPLIYIVLFRCVSFEFISLEVAQPMHLTEKLIWVYDRGVSPSRQQARQPG